MGFLFLKSSDSGGDKNVGELELLKITTSLKDTFENLSKPFNESVNQNPAKIAPLRKTHSAWDLMLENKNSKENNSLVQKVTVTIPGVRMFENIIIGYYS